MTIDKNKLCVMIEEADADSIDLVVVKEKLHMMAATLRTNEKGKKNQWLISQLNEMAGWIERANHNLKVNKDYLSKLFTLADTIKVDNQE